MFGLMSWAWAGQTCGGEPVSGRAPAIEQALAFHTGKATLVEEAGPAIERLACWLAQEPAWSVRVEVYSDTQGSSDYNLRMSQDRADAVQAALALQGTDPARVEAVGYGESPPRRVEIYLGADPSADRPAAPVIPPRPPPTPAPAPPTPPDWCARALAATGAVPRWSGARCEADAISWSCAVPEPPQALAASLSRCARVLEDGGSWFVTVPQGTLTVQASGQGSRVSWR